MESPTSSSCQHATLARSPAGQVSVCVECGVVHVSMACVSIRLEVSAFLDLAEMLSQAQRRLLSMPPPEGTACHGASHAAH